MAPVEALVGQLHDRMSDAGHQPPQDTVGLIARQSVIIPLFDPVRRSRIFREITRESLTGGRRRGPVSPPPPPLPPPPPQPLIPPPVFTLLEDHEARSIIDLRDHPVAPIPARSPPITQAVSQPPPTPRMTLDD